MNGDSHHHALRYSTWPVKIRAVGSTDLSSSSVFSTDVPKELRQITQRFSASVSPSVKTEEKKGINSSLVHIE